MKKLATFLFALLICNICVAHTINWHVGNSVYTTTTCTPGADVTPPTPPAKTGYTFEGWFAYAPIEYLESTGTQWIDTQQNLIYGHRYVAKVEYTDITDYHDRGSLILGTLTTNNGVFIGILDKHFYFRLITTTKTGDIITPNKIYTFDLQLKSSENSFLNIYDANNATQSYLQIYTYQNINKLNYYLFGINFDNTFAGSSKIKLYKFEVYDSDNILIHNMIPVLDKDGIPCMFDKVEQKFYYNAGTGDFIAGPIISE